MNNYCSQCGSPVKHGALKCEYCGAPIRPSVYRQPFCDGHDNRPLKNKGTAILLAMFLGSLGIHKFYLGDVGKGVLYLLFCWTYIPCILAFIEMITMICASDERFEIKYNCRLR